MLRPIAALLISSLLPGLLSPGSLCLAQASAALAQQTAAPAQPATITIPSGTVIPLTLVSPIKKKSTKAGDTVRAQVAFPITIGNQIAIPEGTYVEGIVQALAAKANTKSKSKITQPPVNIHFTRLLFANGYTVNLDAVNTARITAPMPHLDDSPVQLAGNVPPSHGPSPDGAFFAPDPLPDPQTTSTLPPLPHVGPSTGEVVALIAGPVALVTVVAIALHLHHGGGNSDYVLLSPGYQFQMTLQNPLTLSVASVDAAAASQPK